MKSSQQGASFGAVFGNLAAIKGGGGGSCTAGRERPLHLFQVLPQNETSQNPKSFHFLQLFEAKTIISTDGGDDEGHREHSVMQQRLSSGAPPCPCCRYSF
uniref:Uncharacterized protein n=1 Tax=Corethron hystrix TaxID=216773 RepID=A0A7S1BKF3_9STRA